MPAAKRGSSTTAKKATTTAKKKPSLEAKEYRLLKYNPITFTLKTGRDNKLIVFDEVKEVNRTIRHCPNEKSIFTDEQSPNAIVEPIIFVNGLLHLKATDVLTQQFLEAHPSKGVVFEVIDDAADAEELIDMEETLLDIKQAIRDKVKESGGEEALRVIVSVLTSNVSGTSKMSVAELKNQAYLAADENPYRFIDDDGNVTIFEDSEITRKAVAQQAFNSGIIQVTHDSRKIQWSDNKATICNIPTGKNYLDYFCTFLETDDGLLVASEIAKRA